MNKTLQFNNGIRLRQWAFVIGAFALMTIAVIAHHLMVNGNAAFIDMRGVLSAEMWYQVVLAGLALAYLVAVKVVHPLKYQMFDQGGSSAAYPAPVIALGISGTHSWRVVGRVGVIVFGAIALFYAYVSVWHRVIPPLEQIIPALGLGAVLAGGSAFAVTVITRFGIVVTLHDVLPARTIYLLTALLYAVPQYYLFPGGIVRAVIAGVMGWLLAKSILETRGAVWAWSIQFVYDWVVYSALLSMMSL